MRRVLRMHRATIFRYPSRPSVRIAAYAAATAPLARVPRSDRCYTLVR